MGVMSPLKPKPHYTAGEGSQAKLPSFSKVVTSSFSLMPMFLIYMSEDFKQLWCQKIYKLLSE